MVSDLTFAAANGACLICLNPSFNGIWSRTLDVVPPFGHTLVVVLILLLMEYGLGLKVQRP